VRIWKVKPAMDDFDGDGGDGDDADMADEGRWTANIVGDFDEHQLVSSSLMQPCFVCLSGL
jgi:hypothetical protein